MEFRDPISSSSHLLAAAWAVFATSVMMRAVPKGGRRHWAILVYGASMIALFLASGLFHALPMTMLENPVTFRFFQRLDQSAILGLIAGTNTPIMAVLLSGFWRRVCLGLMWGLAFTGIALLWLLGKPPHYSLVIVGLAMGWLGLFPLRLYYREVGWRAMNWVWLGAILYSLGAVCEMIEWPRLSEGALRVGPHEIFHFFAAAGSVAFFVFIAKYVVPFRNSTQRNP